MTAEGALLLFRVSTGAAILAGMLTVGSVIGVFVSTLAMTRDADTRIANTIQSAADANERAASIQQTVNWRTTSLKQVNQLVVSLQGSVGNLHLIYISGDPESFYYTQQLNAIFTTAKWNVTEQAYAINGIPVGLIIKHPSDPQSALIKTALLAANIEVNSKDASPPQPGLFYGSSEKPGEAVLFVGLRKSLIPKIFQ